MASPISKGNAHEMVEHAAKIYYVGNSSLQILSYDSHYLFLEVAYANVPTTPYELPDGQTIEVGEDRSKISDILFNPYLSQTIPGVDGFGDSTSILGLPRMVLDSVNRCDIDIRKELVSSILRYGGLSSILQLKEHLEKEVMEESAQNAPVKVLASGNSIGR